MILRTVIFEIDTDNSDQNMAVNGTAYVLCGPQPINEDWQKASGYVGAVLMLVLGIFTWYVVVINIKSGEN